MVDTLLPQIKTVRRNKKCGLFQINQEVDDYVEHVTGLNGIADAGLENVCVYLYDLHFRKRI